MKIVCPLILLFTLAVPGFSFAAKEQKISDVIDCRKFEKASKEMFILIRAGKTLDQAANGITDIFKEEKRKYPKNDIALLIDELKDAVKKGMRTGLEDPDEFKDMTGFYCRNSVKPTIDRRYAIWDYLYNYEVKKENYLDLKRTMSESDARLSADFLTPAVAVARAYYDKPETLTLKLGDTGFSPLIYASNNGYVEILKAMLDYQNVKNEINNMDKWGNSPLSVASFAHYQAAWVCSPDYFRNSSHYYNFIKMTNECKSAGKSCYLEIIDTLKKAGATYPNSQFRKDWDNQCKKAKPEHTERIFRSSNPTVELIRIGEETLKTEEKKIPGSASPVYDMFY